MSSRRVIVVGGGAAGFFAAITCAETTPDAEVTVLERGPQFLSKVRISRGGRCNVTHARDRLLLATGGCRAAASGQLAVSLGHTLEPPVPSLFTFHIETPWLRELAGISVESVEASAPGAQLRERGALLLTHWGLSGPMILRLSAWGAGVLHGLTYGFPLQLNW